MRSGRRDGAGNDIDLVVFLYDSVLDCKCLLKDDRIFVRGIRVTSKAKIPQTVSDIFVLIFLYTLKNMRMMADY